MGKYLDMIQDLRGEEAITPTTTLHTIGVEEYLDSVAPPGVAGIETAETTHRSYEIHEINEFNLPFPIGYDGLPRAQVEMALAWLDKVGITDPILQKYNVISWVRSHLQWHGQNRGELYEVIEAEQLRLGRILDPNGETTW